MIDNEKAFISIVFHVRNSEKYIEFFLRSILAEIDKKFQNYELVCVNNDCKDNTIPIVKKIVSELKREKVILNIINMSECVSFEEAISCGIQFAIGDFIFEFDVPIIDYSPDLIFEAYKKLLEDIDVVSIAPNYKSTVFQKGYYGLYNFGVEKDKSINPERLRVISRRAINRVSEINSYYSLSAPIYKNCGLKTYTIFYKPGNDVIKYDRREFNKRLNKAIETIIVHTNSFPKILLIFATVFCVAALMLIIVDLIVALMFFSISIILLVSTLIVKYLSVLLNMTYVSKIQLIKSIEKVVK